MNAPVQPGFSLLEMMVALAVAGILFFVALPTYQYAVLKSTRMAARVTLMEVMARQEQYFANNKRYATDLGAIGLSDPYHVDNQGSASDPANASYRISLELTEGEYAGALAVPLNRQAGDHDCLAFSLSRLGVRAVTGTLSERPRECW
ncbi:MAG: type IV pilin protein [Halieaceae bacterium]|nr:type IV pilin protein [Halieaceae bacterium]